MRDIMNKLLAFCPFCKTFETLYFDGDTLVPTRKFYQKDGHVYHDCGSCKPCHLLVCLPTLQDESNTYAGEKG